MTSKKNVLITGGAGFGGSGLAKELLKKGHDVRIIDIVAPNEAWRLKGVIDNVDYRWKSAQDIKDDDMKGIDSVVHMAAQADVPMGFTAPFWTGWEETMGTIPVLEACRGKNLDRFVLASTGNVIGRPLYLPINEKHPVVPHNPYSATKASQELLAHAYRRCYDIPTAVMRNGIVYGPGMRKQIFIYIWLKNILNNKPITIEGGEQTRDPCYASDTMDAWVKVLEAPREKVIGETFQVSRGKEWHMKDIAKMCMKVAGKEVPIVYTDYRPGERGQRECFDNSFAEKQVGYKPKIDLEEGLKPTWKWVQEQEAYNPLS